MIEMVVNRRVHGREFLQRTHSPEPMHGTFASPKRLVRILSPMVDPTAVAFLACSTVAWQTSIPRSANRSSTLRSDSGYFTYSNTAALITSGELLK